MIRGKKTLVWAVALIGVVTMLAVGFEARHTSAARGDCSTNSINNQNANGGCGATTPAELVADARANMPSDLQAIYSNYGLKPADYDRFAKTAQTGTLFRDGRVEVNGQVVMTDAVTTGREKFNEHRMPVTIGGKTYYHAAPEFSFASGVQSLPVMVMFDDDGVAQATIMNDCGNPVKGQPVRPSFECKALNMTSLGNDTYSFTSQIAVGGTAKLAKVVYDFGDGTTATRTNPGEAVKHTFTQASLVKVTAYINLPGGKQVTTTADGCAKKIVVKPKEQPVCPIPGKQNLPPDSPDCVEQTPPPSAPPTPPAELPNTGIGNVIGIFAATAVGGAIAHRLVWSRRFGR